MEVPPHWMMHPITFLLPQALPPREGAEVVFLTAPVLPGRLAQSPGCGREAPREQACRPWLGPGLSSSGDSRAAGPSQTPKVVKGEQVPKRCKVAAGEHLVFP